MRNMAMDRNTFKSMVIHMKHARGSSGLQESEHTPNTFEILPDVHRRTPSAVAPPHDEDESEEERWRDDGGESGEVV